MPQIEIERLDKGSSASTIQAAISACIANEVRAGKTQEEAQGICFGMARDKTGGMPAPPQGGK